MIETYSKFKNNLARGTSSPGNHLMSRVVLLIGNDADLLHALAARLAAGGSDIALASSQLSAEAVETIRESVQSFGGRFLLIDTSNIYRSETVINKIKKELGRMDIVVDMSAHKSEESADWTNQKNTPQPQWWLSQAILQEIRN